jgi:hypothetical protein
LLRVHRSNFEISGFTEQPELRDLVALARERKIPLMEDLGSGALFDLRSVGIDHESTVLDSLRAGVDVVTYSGDKLLGGPQAGLLSGRPDLISQARANSLFRALRVDKLTYAALEATLLAYVRQNYDGIPTLQMMRRTKREIAARARDVATNAPTGIQIELCDGESLIGGGAAPSASLATCLLALSSEHFTADQLATKLRENDPPIIARVEDGRVLLDLRTVFPEQDAVIAGALMRISGTGVAQPATRSLKLETVFLLTLYTIGHSTRSLEELIAAVQAHSIKTLVDIRSFPTSRRLPHFNRESLETALPAVGIRYEWMKELGGRRKKTLDISPNTALRNDSFRNYADHMLSQEFQDGIARLLQFSEESRTAYMCAERVYFHCHRMLVSDYLVAHGHEVLHIDGTGPVKPHKLMPDARLENGLLLYKGDSLF